MYKSQKVKSKAKAKSKREPLMFEEEMKHLHNLKYTNDHFDYQRELMRELDEENGLVNFIERNK